MWVTEQKAGFISVMSQETSPSQPGKTLLAANNAIAMTIGFKGEVDKRQFGRDIDDLRSALRDLQMKIRETNEISPDEKDNFATEVMQQAAALATAKEVGEALPNAHRVAQDQGQRIESCLQKTGTLLDAINELANKAIQTGATLDHTSNEHWPFYLPLDT